jgi:hypothetical protein
VFNLFNMFLILRTCLSGCRTIIFIVKYRWFGGRVIRVFKVSSWRSCNTCVWGIELASVSTIFLFDFETDLSYIVFFVFHIIIVDISLRDYYCTIDNWLSILRYFDNNYYFLDRKSGYSLVGKCACKTLWRMSFVRCLHKNIMTIPLF